MFDSIFIGMSGLQSFSKGLKVISNNVANMNTAGFKSTTLNFGDMYYQQGASGFRASYGGAQFGTGVAALGTHVNFQQGDTRQTGNPLDMSIAGEGFFVTQDANGGDHVYTRVGQFDFDDAGYLVEKGTDRRVLGFNSNGTLVPISLDAMRNNSPQATTEIEFLGNLSSTATAHSINSVKLIDSLGAEHTVRLDLAAKTGETGVWTVKMVDGTTETAVGEIKFTAGTPAASNVLTLNYAPAGLPAFGVTLDFSKSITSFASGTSSTLTVASSDGVVAGTLSQVTFDETGVMTVTYSNGEESTGMQLALAQFESTDALVQTTGGGFTASDPKDAQIGRPGSKGLGNIASSQVEGSNVNLSAEFSELIVMQRGYQASSQIVSTANDMLRELFEMKGRG
ncbi:flagellar hook protein FlgE [Aquabacterium sp.]|uniref:flagellar hook protein FlgE n=1 Tax=Aquabacterium sp. TaxID=1872578 RepID=UPI002C1EF39D|nr:flagellar hook-basal body complex protein [Aquabacterium sp.]HSW06367.1 flagellar hook-basal body complex protein [Aquabacterium sp.]